MNHIPLFQAEKVIHLKDEDYYDYLMQKIMYARKSILGNVFLVWVLDPEEPKESGKLKELLDELVYAHWRGLDVRLIIGAVRKGIMKFNNSLSLEYLKQKGLPVKLYDYIYDAGTHSKYVIIDDELMILGSANWTNNAMFRNRDDSVAVFSVDAAYMLRRDFEKVWHYVPEEKNEDR